MIEVKDKEINKTLTTIKIFRNIAWFFVGLGLLIFLLGLIYGVVSNKEFNAIGDFVGGVAGSAWALAGLFFIYIAFLGQKVEIKYQQEDLKLTREELKETKEVFIKQSNIMSNQQIDNTFFNLINNHRKIIESFNKRENKIDSNTLLTGYEILKEKCIRWKKIFMNYSEIHKYKLVFDQTHLGRIPYDLVLIEPEVTLLFNSFAHILEFIKAKVTKENQEFYYDTYINNLTTDEKWLIEAYNYINDSNKSFIHLGEYSLSAYHENIRTIIQQIQLNNINKLVELSDKVSVSYDEIHIDSNLKFSCTILLISNNNVFETFRRVRNYNLNKIEFLEDFELKNRLLEIGKINTSKIYTFTNLFLVIRQDSYKHIFNFEISPVEIREKVQFRISYRSSLDKAHKDLIQRFKLD